MFDDGAHGASELLESVCHHSSSFYASSQIRLTLRRCTAKSFCDVTSHHLWRQLIVMVAVRSADEKMSTFIGGQVRNIKIVPCRPFKYRSLITVQKHCTVCYQSKVKATLYSRKDFINLSAGLGSLELPFGTYFPIADLALRCSLLRQYT